jgi:hypothetical protein
VPTASRAPLYAACPNTASGPVRGIERPILVCADAVCAQNAKIIAVPHAGDIVICGIEHLAWSALKVL